MNLKHISDLDLERNLTNYVKQERGILSVVLHHIKEFDTRRLYLKLGFPNLYEYLIKAQKYSSGVAQRRIEAARLLKNIPEIEGKIQNGRLHLSNINELSRAVKQKEAESKMVVTIEQKKELLAAIEDTTIGETQQILAMKLNLEVKALEKKTVQKDGSVVVQFTLSQAQYDKLMRCRDLGSHVLVNKGDVGLASTLEMTCDQYLKAKLGKQTASDAEEVSHGDKPTLEAKSQNPTSAPEVKINKSITPKTRKIILNKYQCCQHVDPITKRKCGSRFLPQVDHVMPQWAGGNHAIENLTLFCAFHNREKYRRESRIMRL